MFKVRWELGDATWEPLDVVEDLEALDHYLELEGVTSRLISVGDRNPSGGEPLSLAGCHGTLLNLI